MTNTTPAAKWRENGEPDPHGNHYDCERAQLALGDLTDDELANALFIHGDIVPSLEDVIAGKAKMPIVYLTAGKERIRWLSRRLVEATCQCDELQKDNAELYALLQLKEDEINRMVKRTTDAENELANALNQRDALLAATEEIIRISDREHDAWDAAKAVIAEIKGGAE